MVTETRDSPLLQTAFNNPKIDLSQSSLREAPPTPVNTGELRSLADSFTDAMEQVNQAQVQLLSEHAKKINDMVAPISEKIERIERTMDAIVKFLTLTEDLMKSDLGVAVQDQLYQFLMYYNKQTPADIANAELLMSATNDTTTVN